MSLEHLLGDRIGTGGHREVYKHTSDETLVIKKVKNNNVSYNKSEYKTWVQSMYLGFSNWLVPCVHISMDNIYLVQLFGKPIEKEEVPENIPHFLMYDWTNPRQWVKINGQVKMCDYDHDQLRSLEKEFRISNKCKEL